MAVWCFFCKVVCPTPHANFAISHVEAFFTLIDQVWLSLTCTVIHLCNNIILCLFINFRDLINFVLEYSPKFFILNSLNFYYLKLRHCQLEIRDNSFPFIWAFLNIFQNILFFTNKKINSFIPYFWEIVSL